MPRIISLLALALLVACDGAGPASPTAPTPPAPPPVAGPPPLAPGRYMVYLLATSLPDRVQPDCTPALFTDGGVVPIPVVRFPGAVVAEEEGFRVKPDQPFDLGLDFTLRPSPTHGLTGSLSGSVRDVVLRPPVVFDGGEPDTSAAVVGLAPGVSSLVGEASGRMLFPASASCRLGRWMMIRE